MLIKNINCLLINYFIIKYSIITFLFASLLQKKKISAAEGVILSDMHGAVQGCLYFNVFICWLLAELSRSILEASCNVQIFQ